jgi:YD repeat-containing protein
LAGITPVIALVAQATPAAAQQPGLTTTLNIGTGATTTFAGSGSNANVDGTGTAASFKALGGIAVVGGAAYVNTDSYIRKIDVTTAQVTTLAGNPNLGGCTDGSSGTQSSFNSSATSLDTDGTYLFTATNCAGGRVRKTAVATGATSTITSLSNASYLTYGPDGFLYVTEGGSSPSVFRVDPTSGATTTFATLPSDVAGAFAITSDASALWVVATTTGSTQRLYKLTLPGAVVSLFASGSDFSLSGFTSAGDYLYGAAGNANANVIRQYTKATGAWSNVSGAGTASQTTTPGVADGTSTDAWFQGVGGLVSDGTNLWVSDAGNFRFRRVVRASALASSQPPGQNANLLLNPAAVSTVAGSGTNANTDGTGTAASFRGMGGVAVSGNFAYVSSEYFIRKVDLTTSQVSTLAGVLFPSWACTDSPAATSATFNSGANALATDGYYLYGTTSCAGGSLRRTSMATGATSTIMAVSLPGGVALGPDGYLYVTSGRAVLKVDRVNGTSSTFATLPSDVNSAVGIVADNTALWVGASASSNRIYKVALADASVALLSSNNPSASALASAGNYLYAASATGAALVRYAKSDGTSATVAGQANPGYQDGAGIDAWFSAINGLVSDGTNLFISDQYRLRRAVAVKQAGTAGGPTRPNESLGASNPSEPHQCDCQRAMADPINTATGNFYEGYTDLTIPGRGIPLGFEHTYNSLASGQNGPLGYGWAHTYNMSLVTDAYAGAGSYDVIQENGSQVTFSPNGAGGYTAAPRVLAALVHNGDGTFTFTRRARDRFVFDATGKLTKEIDLNGYVTTLAYNGSGQLSTITDAANRALTLTYTGTHLTQINDPVSRSVSFGYNDTGGNLTDVTDVGGGNTHFTYDANHLLLTVRDPNTNTVTTNSYDSARRVLTQTDALSRQTTLAYSSTATTVTDPKGNVTVQNYADGELTSMTKGSGSPQAATWTYTYDQNTLGLATVSDALNHATGYTYDAAGNLLTRTDALNHVTTNTYDTSQSNTHNNVLTAQDPKGVTTTYTYDANNVNRLSTSAPLVGSTPAVSQKTTFHYDDASHPGDVTSLTDPNAKTTTFTYDANGDRTSVTDPLGNKAVTCDDVVGRKTATIAPKGTASGVTCASASPAAFTTYYTTNAFGDVLNTTDPLGHQVVRTYDADRNVRTLRDPNGNQTSYAYDAANELTTTTRPDTTTLTNDYWPDGTLKHQYDAKNNATGYAYDAVGRLTSVTDPLNRTTTYGYDGAGNRTSITDSANQTTTLAYDAVNRVTAMSYSDGHTPNVSAITYDADDQRTAMTDGTGPSTWNWDSLHRLTSSSNGAGQSVAYAYDLKGQLTSVVYPGTTPGGLPRSGTGLVHRTPRASPTTQTRI